VREGAAIVRGIHRKMTSSQHLAGKAILTKRGMTATGLTPDQIDESNRLAKPLMVERASRELGKANVDQLMGAVEAGKPKPCEPGAVRRPIQNPKRRRGVSHRRRRRSSDAGNSLSTSVRSGP
jgi:hypothetical protein